MLKQDCNQDTNEGSGVRDGQVCAHTSMCDDPGHSTPHEADHQLPLLMAYARYHTCNTNTQYG